MNNTSVENKIPNDAKAYAKELTTFYHNIPGATSTDPETRRYVKQAYESLKNNPRAFKAFDNLFDALVFAAFSSEADGVIELPAPENGAQYAVIGDIPTALVAGARMVVAWDHIYEAYEAVTGKPSPISRISLNDEGDTTDTIEEV